LSLPTRSSSVETLARDVRHGLRRLTRDWRFTLAAVLILGLGIGANTAIFSVVDAVLFRNAAPAAADRLVNIYQREVNPGSQDAVSYPAYLDMAARTDVFAATTATSIPHDVTWQHAGVLRGGLIENTTASYPAVLGLRVTFGRWFTANEDTPGAPVVAVLTYHSWKHRFGGDPGVVGRIIRMDGVPVRIVGVGPAGHNGTIGAGVVVDFWMPIESLRAFDAATMLDRRPPEAVFLVKARLQDGVTVAQAQAAMDILGRRLAADYPNEDPGRGISVLASTDVWIHPQLDPVVAATVTFVLAAVGLVLAIACSNLATLLLVRGASRAKEVSIRLAVGATRGQLVRQLLTESVLLAVAGGVTGCLLAWAGIQWLRSVELPVVVDIALDGTVLAFAIAVSAITGLACGLAPALSATKVEVLPALRGEGGSTAVAARRLTLKNALIVFQVSMSLLLLGAASLFLQWSAAERAQPAGYAVDGVAMIETDSRFSDAPAARTSAMYDELLRRVAAIPGVESAALAHGLPMRLTGERLDVEGADGPRTRLHAGRFWAGPGFIETLQIPLLHGRTFDARDRPGTPRVAVISETMARDYFGTSNAVGRRFRRELSPDGWVEVIGVVRDTGTGVLDPVRDVFYLSYLQEDARVSTIVARSSLDAEGLVAAMQREARAVDATLPVVTATTMARDRQDALAGSQATAAALGALGMVGLLLASIGLYAVIAFAVARRSREIGIRIALGARRTQVVWTVVRGVAWLVGLGTVIGLGLSVLATLALRASVAPAPGITLFQPSVDPLALLALAGIMGVVGVAAAFVPARRAAATDPLVALRRD
jgi:predicted permease